MTIINFGQSRYWDGRAASGAPGDAGPYSDDQYSDTLADLAPYGNNANAGVLLGSYPGVTDAANSYIPLRVTPTAPATNAVRINPGAALVQGRWYGLDTPQNQAITANASGNSRYDAIVLRVDYAGQTVRPYYLVGTPAVFPVVPSLTQTAGVIWDIALAYILVPSGFATITATDIYDARQFLAPDRFSVQVDVDTPPNSYEDGLPFKPDTAYGSVGMESSNVLGDMRILGVNERYVDINQNPPPRMISHGIGLVEVSAAVSYGQYLEQSGTAGRARPTNTPENAFAVALQSASGAGQKILALINMVIPNRPAFVQIIDQKATGTNGGTFTSGAWRTRDLNTEVIDAGGIASVAANQITLAAGTYDFRIACPALQVGAHKARLQNITAGTTIAVSRTAYSNSAGLYTQSDAMIAGRFTLTVQSVLEVQHQCAVTAAGAGFGNAGGFGEVEIYTTALFWRIYTP